MQNMIYIHHYYSSHIFTFHICSNVINISIFKSSSSFWVLIRIFFSHKSLT
uniref:Uncharacterized protein n=1 Tax=Lepeophtheirus salmonis TaxID=72036 RepID=A0A0K2TB85_LEPSM